METNSQLHHDLILPSDEGVEESLVDMEGLLSSRHKQLLLKVFVIDMTSLPHLYLSPNQCLAKKESSKFTADSRQTETEPLQLGAGGGGGGVAGGGGGGGGGGGLKRLQSERFSQAAGGELLNISTFNFNR